MKERCLTKTNHSYSQYGGRGIKICDRWLGPEGFANFVEDVGAPPPGTSLDRVDVNGNYEPGNVRWATPKEQSANTRRSASRVAIVLDMVEAVCAKREDGLTAIAAIAVIRDLLLGSSNS